MDTLSSVLWVAPVLIAAAFLVTGLRGAFAETRKPPRLASKAGEGRHWTPPLPHESGTLEETLAEEGLGTRSELATLASAFPSRSILLTLVEQGRIDERRFTSIWARHSGLESIVVTPEDIPAEMLALWPESLARRHRAMPLDSSPKGGIAFAFVEPPGRHALKEIETLTGKRINPALITPANLLSLCDAIYPGLTLKKRSSPFQQAFDSLRDGEKQAVRHFQMTRRISLGEALGHHGAFTPSELGEINSAALEADHVPMDALTLSIPLLRALTPLFCELHGILPLNNGSLAINHHRHPHTTAKIQEILGSAFTFQTSTPMAFMRLWRNFTALRFPQDTLMDHLVAVELLTITHAEHIREARRLLAEPIDRVLLKLGLASPRQIFHAIRTTSALEITRQPVPPTDTLVGVLDEEHRTRSGIQPVHSDDAGVTFHIARLPSPDDATEIMHRCDGCAWKFELSPALLDTPS